MKRLFFFQSMFVVLWVSTTSLAYAASDPTKPLFGQAVVSPAKIKSRLVLQSIIKSNNHHKVVINGKLLNQGDVISGYRVKKITTGKVLLVSDEKRLELALFTQGKLSKAVKN